MQRLLHWLNRNFKILGVIAILLCLGTWAIDLAGVIHPCVYCRTQRTAIGLVGVLMLFPNPREWWLRWPGAALCFFAAHVSCAQIFMIIYAIDARKPFSRLNLLMASGALCILTGQALLLFMEKNED